MLGQLRVAGFPLFAVISVPEMIPCGTSPWTACDNDGEGCGERNKGKKEGGGVLKPRVLSSKCEVTVGTFLCLDGMRAFLHVCGVPLCFVCSSEGRKEGVPPFESV